MSNLYGLIFQLEEPTPNKPTKVINIMVDEEGEKYINYLHQQLQQKENIIKEVREYANTDKNCVPKHIKDYINNLLDKEVN